MVSLRLRLKDRFGDNGIIGIIIGKADGKGSILIDTWLMSCRVLGRKVEEATLGLIIEEARRLGGERLVGKFQPTLKNGMVSDHYARLGFKKTEILDDNSTLWQLHLRDFTLQHTAILLKRV